MKIIIILGIASIFALGTASCSGCVKNASKKATEIGISAVEGVAEAVDEHGERIAEKSADAAGKLAVGVGRSFEKQLDEHATHVASVTGKTLVQSLDGFTEGFNAEVGTHYDKLPYTENFVSGVSLDYFAKHKKIAIIDAYFIIPENGNYNVQYECFDKQDKLFLTKKISVDRTTSEQNRKYTLVSFALNTNEVESFNNLKNVKITVTKQ